MKLQKSLHIVRPPVLVLKIVRVLPDIHQEQRNIILQVGHIMKAETYPFVVRPLPYEYDALLPVLDAELMTFHHDKHYKTYVDNLNAALAD